MRANGALAIAGCALLLLAGCSGGSGNANESKEPGDGPRADVSRVNLPGFSIELPAGTVVESVSTPATGRYKVKLPKTALFDRLKGAETEEPEIRVSWSADSYTYESWNETVAPFMLETMKKSLPDARMLHTEKIDDIRWIAIVGPPNVPVATGVVQCDPQFSINVLYVHHLDVARQVESLRPILESVRCAVTDANREKLVATVRLPEQFGRMDSPDAMGFRTLDGEVVYVSFTEGYPHRDAESFELVAKSLFFAVGEQAKHAKVETLSPKEQNEETDVALVRVVIPQVEGELYVGAKHCPKHGATLMLIMSAPARDDARARERQAQVQCPGGESTTYRDFRSMAGEACAAHDAQGCKVLKELAEE